MRHSGHADAAWEYSCKHGSQFRGGGGPVSVFSRGKFARASWRRPAGRANQAREERGLRRRSDTGRTVAQSDNPIEFILNAVASTFIIQLDDAPTETLTYTISNGARADVEEELPAARVSELSTGAATGQK